ncbi:MAG TPA: hypothetical protein DCZ91_09810 [Lachnospiraceae bacterium]|nr:hypothetical protein [Lachnospiraceae bacterium]
MTEKELHKLRRHDLLQLLLAQGREAAQLQAKLEATTAELNQLQETNSRFIERMDNKDAQIEKLKGRLNEKDVQVERFKERLKEKDGQLDRLKDRLNQKDTRIGELRKVIEEYRSGRIFEVEGQVSIAEVGQKLEGIFAAAQKAVEQYLENMGAVTETTGFSPDREPEDADSAKRTAETRQPDFSPTEIKDAEEQDEEETDNRSGGSSHTGAA